MHTHTHTHTNTLTGSLEVGSVDRSVEEGGPDQVGPLEVGVSHDALLKGHALEILSRKVGTVEIDAARDGDGPTGLQRGGSSCTCTVVRCERSGRNACVSVWGFALHRTVRRRRCEQKCCRVRVTLRYITKFLNFC